MKKIKSLFPATLMTICISISACSQPSGKNNASVYQATTPCNDAVKTLLGIPATTKCDMMKWNLTLYNDSKTSPPASFKLVYIYGLSKQGSRGFMDGASTIELGGKCAIGRGIMEKSEAAVYTLHADSSTVSLSFIEPDKNILHLLDRDKNLMVGNGAWSYTLNRLEPVRLASNKFTSQRIESKNISADSTVFDGRTPCYEPLLALSGSPMAGCQIIKCRLILYNNFHTHEPANFKLYTIHVGTGDTRYATTGRWMVTRGTKNDPKAILYQLQPDSQKPFPPLVFLKGDDNILFFAG